MGLFAGLLLALTVIRVATIFVSPLELNPEEAQYWLWSRHLAFGYFSKPPMIAWLIRATTAFSDREGFVRLGAPILHGLAAVTLERAGRRLYDGWTGVWAGLIYTLMPGVQLSSAIIATDAPLMLCLGLGLWSYACLWRAPDALAGRGAAAALGLSLGAAMLSKYAALYIIGGMGLHAMVSAEARRLWRWDALVLAVGCGLAAASPNLIWNALHHFQTVAHTAADANLDENSERAGWFDPRGALGFVLGQFGVFGPVAFTAFLIAAVRAFRRSAAAEDRMLLALAAPAFLVVLGEAVISRANANWAGAGYAPGAILVAAMLGRPGGRPWSALLVVTQGLIAAVFILIFADPSLADRLRAANAIKRARGWAASTQAVVARAAVSPRLSAVAVDDRFLFNAISYYGRDVAGRPAGKIKPPLLMWVRGAKPRNQAETAAPLTQADGDRVLMVNAVPTYSREIAADFTRTEPLRAVVIPLDAKHSRRMAFLLGSRFKPQPRDAVSGLPKAP